ncbi:hypothetical protein [Streptococcus sp. DD12]|uniref:hypothetical protein n=1 Tax=Streptococcus sp. DD12 TaxID=1777880 RepID=UPI00079918EC|nr:hypothetical protein [Streptococcus sp. DD12]KXT75882.1 hypothetical protein STRDD12_00994 [Streptococcus sp. DD12]
MTPKEKWLNAFENRHGRKPSPQEFQAAKAVDFDVTDLVTPETPQAQEEPVTQAPQAIAEASQLDAPEVQEKTKATAVEAAQPAFQGQPEPVAAASQQDKASIIPPTIILVGAVIFLVVALVVPVPLAWLFVALSLATATAGLVFFILDLKKSNKVLSIIAFAVSLVLFMGTAGTVLTKQLLAVGSQAQEAIEVIEEVESNDSGKDSSDIDNYVDEDAAFKWTEKDFRALKFSNKYAGTRLTTIVKKYGKATRGTVGTESLTLDYSGKSGDTTKSVSLTFRKDDEGHYVLMTGYATNISKAPVEAQDSDSYTSNWTKSDYEALKVQESGEDSKTGTTLKDIVDKHGNPTDVQMVINNSGNGFGERLSITYSDYDTEDKLQYVSLDFEKVDDSFYLTYKYGSDD